MRAPDLRAGAALTIAALGAKGRSVIENVCHIDRGYDDMDGVLKSLGARIERRKKIKNYVKSYLYWQKIVL